MLVGIHSFYRNIIEPFSLKYCEIMDFNGLKWVHLDINDMDFWEKLKTCSHFIYRWGGHSDQYQLAHTILPVIEKDLNIRCFPDSRTYWHHDDKIRQYYLLRNLGFPIIESWIFWERLPALKWVKNNAQFPIVFKLKSGAGSKDVLLVKSRKKAVKLVNKMFGSGIFLGKIPGNYKIKYNDFKLSKYFDALMKKSYRLIKKRDVNYNWMKEKNYVYFQKYLPANEFDTRVTVIGDRAFAFRRFNRDNDFRSSGSGKINYETDKINLDFIRIAFDVSNKMNFQSMSFDFLYDEFKKPSFCEISYTFQDKAVYDCQGYWDSNLIWHKGHLWPQYCQLVDFLGIPDLKQPDIRV